MFHKNAMLNTQVAGLNTINDKICVEEGISVFMIKDLYSQQEHRLSYER